MKLTKLILNNFRSYYGRHEIALTSNASTGMIVIFGDNMSGKTGLFSAINWCLYGQAVGRRGEKIPVYMPGDRENNFLINAKAIEVGDYSVKVEMQWEHNGDLWILDRERKCEGDPLNDADFLSHVSLQIGDRVEYPQEVSRRINQILHHRAAQFYFFDGELLSQYEKWLENPSDREVRVKEAVELTVGTAALRLYEEMERVADAAESEQAKVVKKANRAESLLNQLDERQSRRGQVVREIAEFEQHIETLKTEADEIEKVHGALAAYAETLGRIGELERNVTTQKGKQKEAEIEMQTLVRNEYWIPLTGANERLRNSITAEIFRFAESRDAALRAGLAKASVANGVCEICGREVTGTIAEQLAAQEGEYEPDDTADLDIHSLGGLFNRLTELDRYPTGGNLGQLQLLEEKRMDARAEADSYSEEVKDIRASFPDRPRGDHETEMARLKAIFDDIADTQGLIVQSEEELADVDREIARLRNQVNRIEINPSVLRKARAARIAADGTERALEAFREVAREKVEACASEVFVSLVEEPGYEGICIDEDYRVFPIDHEGAIMPIPSAGGQQLLTLALVGGLNGAAVHDAPVVMDTPAGRIDRPNRERILRWLDTLDQQVILMVHSGEFTSREIADSRVKVAKAFQLQKTDAMSSDIRELDWT